MIGGNEGNHEMTSHAREKSIEQWLHEGIEFFATKRYAEASDLYAKARQKQREQDNLPSVWKRVALPEHFFERMLGFSLPLDHELVIISYDNIATLDLNAPANIQFDDRYPEGGDIYDRKNQTLTYHGKRFQLLGAYRGQPITESQRQEQLVLDLKHENFQVLSKNGSVLLHYWFVDMSGDWGYITFSRDDDFILLGIPYTILIFHREKTELP